MRDAHFDVVGHDDEVVRRRAVGAKNDPIVDLGSLERDPLVHHVVPRDLVLRHAQADSPVVFISMSIGEELVRQRLVSLESRSLENDLFIVVETQPCEPIDDDLYLLVGGSLPVGVLDAGGCTP